jgi:hypothetical protein
VLWGCRGDGKRKNIGLVGWWVVFCFLLNGSSKEGTADGVVVVGLTGSVGSRSSFRSSFVRGCLLVVRRETPAVSGIVYRAGGLRSRHRHLGLGFLVRREKKGDGRGSQLNAAVHAPNLELDQGARGKTSYNHSNRQGELVTPTTLANLEVTIISRYLNSGFTDGYCVGSAPSQ